MHTTDGLPALFIILYLKFFDGKCNLLMFSFCTPFSFHLDLINECSRLQQNRLAVRRFDVTYNL